MEPMGTHRKSLVIKLLEVVFRKAAKTLNPQKASKVFFTLRIRLYVLTRCFSPYISYDLGRWDVSTQPSILPEKSRPGVWILDGLNLLLGLDMQVTVT